MSKHVKGTPFSRTRRDIFSSRWKETVDQRVRPEGMSRKQWRSLTASQRREIRQNRNYVTGRMTSFTSNLEGDK